MSDAATPDDASTALALAMPAYVELRRDVLINADLWTDKAEIIAADWGFEGIMGIPGLSSAEDLARAAAAGAGVNMDYAALVPVPPLRNLTSGGSPIGVAAGGFGAMPLFADAFPVVFSWPLLPGTVSPTDFQVVLNTGETATPVAAALNPNYDYNERHVVVLFGEFGNRLQPGTEGAVYPVALRIVADDAPLQAVGPNGTVSLVGQSKESLNPYVVGPALVGARLTRMSTAGDFAPASLTGASPNDAVSLYGDDAQYRLRLFTNGGFSPDGVSGIAPDQFARFFRLRAVDAAGNETTLTQTGVEYDLGDGKLTVVGLAELGAPADGATVGYDVYYTEDHDNYIDIVLKGDAAAVARLTQVEIPTAAETGYSDIYTPGGPGRTPTPGFAYTAPSRPQRQNITVGLDGLGTVSYAAQRVNDYDQAADLPVTFHLFNPRDNRYFYTASSQEAAALVGAGYQEQGVDFSNEGGSTALSDVYRLYNAATGDHFYTADAAERDALTNNGSGYASEGVAFQAYTDLMEGTTPVLRYYSAQFDDHFYTPSTQAGATAAALGYRSEGTAWRSTSFRRDDAWTGTAGDDALTAGLGADTLTGGDGADAFRFALLSDGDDLVVDFESGVDRVEIFGAPLNGLPAGQTANFRFALDRPQDDDDFFVYDTRTGTLRFDPDGAGSAAAVDIARFTRYGRPAALTAADVFIVGA